MSPPASIPVVCAVLEDGHGRLLLAQRPPHKHLGLKWEFPGGKVEPNEEPQSALVREIREELGCGIRIEAALPRFVHDYGSVLIEMLPFVCRPVGGCEPRAHEHVALRWVDLGELQHIDLAPADWPVVTSYSELRNARR